jgi:hypothetical protein
MENQTINAANNPGLANKLAAEAISQKTEAPEPAKIKVPVDVLVNLPGGYMSPSGEVYRTAEVRELTGKDEEVIVKAANMPKALALALSRGTVKIGDVEATEEVLDKILAADRDAIMLGIYRATFGDTAEFGAYCMGCKDSKTAEINLLEDIKVKVLLDPLEDRAFKVQGKSKEYLVRLPEGKAQRELANNLDKTSSELDSVLLDYCLVEIDGKQVFGKNQVQAIGLADRRLILSEIVKKNPGPQFNDVKITCPDCGGEVVVPISLGTLFQF